MIVKKLRILKLIIKHLNNITNIIERQEAILKNLVNFSVKLIKSKLEN